MKAAIFFRDSSIPKELDDVQSIEAFCYGRFVKVNFENGDVLALASDNILSVKTWEVKQK